MTFNQDAFHGLLRSKGALRFAGGPTLHSVDLSKATDRFPIELIRECLDYVLGEERSLLWWDVMVSEPFQVDPRAGQPVKEVTYGVGNPMGFLSS